jgi:hypothetical protein
MVNNKQVEWSYWICCLVNCLVVVICHFSRKRMIKRESQRKLFGESQHCAWLNRSRGVLIPWSSDQGLGYVFLHWVDIFWYLTLLVTRFAWWWQDLHAIELLRAHIGEWTITQMLDYWRDMCFTGYQLNWNSWIWIPFPVDLDCTLLCTQVDRTRYSSIASGNNCIVQLCKCVSLHL